MSSKIFGPRVCIGGLPGIGSVGKVAADCIGTTLESETLKAIVSPAFPAQVMLVDGVAMPLRVELKSSEIRDDIMILSGDAQPLTPQGMYRLAGQILDTVRAFGVTDFITLAAYVGDSEEMVIGVATDSDLAKELERNGIALLRNGIVGGLNGILVGLCPFYGMRGVCLMGKTSGENLVDIEAAKNLMKVAGAFLQMDISILKLELDETLGNEENVPRTQEWQPFKDDFQMGYR